MRHKELPAEINGFKIVKDLGRVPGKTRKAIVICKVCSREYEAQAYYLKDRKHCGCLRPIELVCTYRKSHPRLFHIYKCMKSRCFNKKDKCFHLYGLKGIKICNQWLQDIDIFCEWSLQNGYQDNLSIDRLDNEKDYSPDNCRWSDTKTQARNRKGIKLTMEKAISIRKEYGNLTRSELSSKYGVALGTINHVLAKTRWAE